jgi:lipoic acid synthetase
MPEQGGSPSRRRLPEWLKVKMGKAQLSERTLGLVRSARLHTVCQSARCPNIGECFSAGTATFLLMGDRCTRNCGFCAVSPGRPEPLDPDEPRRIARAAAEMGLAYAVLTSVTRDDLPDGGAGHFAGTIRAIKAARPATQVEVLVPDFGGSEACIRTVLDAQPEVFNHNLETVRRLQARVRPQASYDTSLSVLRTASGLAPRSPTKSGLMVGLGETDEEIAEALGDLAEAGASIVTLGQYLQPSPRHLPVERYVPPEQFEAYREVGEAAGVKHVVAGPFVRSSYHAEEAARNLPVQAPR